MMRALHAQAAIRSRPAPRLCVQFDGWAADHLDVALKSPTILCLDERCSGRPVPPPAIGLTLWISTRAAARHDVAAAFTAALCERAEWIAEKRWEVETSLQEAVGNAVVHGNLGINSALRCSLDGLAEFGRRMDEGIADPELAALPVTVHAEWSNTRLVLTVEDHGTGFDPAACPPPTPTAMCGRGIATIRSLCQRVDYTNRGRRVKMTIRRAS